MATPPRTLVPILVSLVGALTLLAGCTSSPSGPDSTPTGSSVSAGPASSGPASSGPASTAGPSAPADAVTLDITIKAGQVSPNGTKVDVTKGETVVLNVTSDADDEVHVHTAGDGYELEVKAGVPARGQVVAADTGSFEVESHHLEKIIAILVVR
jgi:hypothetical protein